MKRILMATTGVVLAANAASAQQVATKAPFTVTLGGSASSETIFVSDSQVHSSSRETRLDYRLTLQAEAKSSNGLVYGVNTRLRNNQDSGNQAQQDVVGADVKFLYLSGAWGKVELGDTLAADSQFEIQAPSVGIGQAGYLFGPEAGRYSYYHANEGEYDTKLVYYTPVFSGFQAGVSYTPEKGSSGRDSARSKYVMGSGNTYNDLVSVGLSYSREFGDLALTAGGGIQWGNRKNVSARQSSALGDYNVWHLGSTLKYQNFTFGGHYFKNGETTLARGDDEHGWQLGLTYETGPWGVGTNYARVETDYAERGRASTTDSAWGLGAAYQVASGLSLQADVMRFDFESVARELLTPNKSKNSGTLFTLRALVSF